MQWSNQSLRLYENELIIILNLLYVIRIFKNELLKIILYVKAVDDTRTFNMIWTLFDLI